MSGTNLLTFHHVDQRTHITLLDDAGVLPIIHWVHAIHHLVDLGQLQVLHEIIVQDGLLDHLFGPAGEGTHQELLPSNKNPRRQLTMRLLGMKRMSSDKFWSEAGLTFAVFFFFSLLFHHLSHFTWTRPTTR